jgi:LexA-binding, inner membrane-associated putative hydrolase
MLSSAVAPPPQIGLLARLAGLAASRVVSLVLVVAIVAVDYAIRWHGMGFVARGLIDEPCHVATALVVLGALTRFRGSTPNPIFGWTMLVCSVFIDVDHLPAEFGYWALTQGTPRPYTHALWTLVVLLLGALAARAWSGRAAVPAAITTWRVLAGAFCGVAAHFLRDIATAPMAFWWPLSDVSVEVQYRWYVLAMLVIIAVPLRRHGGHAVTPDEQRSLYVRG